MLERGDTARQILQIRAAADQRIDTRQQRKPETSTGRSRTRQPLRLDAATASYPVSILRTSRLWARRPVLGAHAGGVAGEGVAAVSTVVRRETTVRRPE